MALIAWFPFNETLKNQGCGHMSSDLTLSSPVYENGKNGKNLVLNNVQTNQFTINELIGKDVFTCSFWFKFPAQADHSIKQFTDVITFGVKKKSTGSTATYRMECGDTKNSWVNWYGNGVLTGTGGSIGYNVTPEKWEHMIVVIDGERFYGYHDGELVSTVDINSSYKGDYEFTGTVKIGDSTGMYVSLADVRIYDEPISIKQAKELSKGLFAHYKFENIGGNKNYIVDSYFSKKTNTGLFTFCGNEVICQASEFNLSGNGFGVSLDPNIKTEIKGKTITFSMDYKVEETLTYGTTNPWVGFEASLTYSDSTKQWCKWYGTTTVPTIISDRWMHHSETHNIENKEITSIGLNIYFRDTKGKIKFRNPKIEIGDTDTPWIPNPADQKYQSYRNEIGLDKSGYGYNGILHGDLTYNLNSPRYKNCAKMDTGYLHYLPSPLNADSEAFTFTCWLYPTKNQTMALYNDRTAQGDGLAIFYLGGGIRFDTGSSANFQSGSITVNAWNFVTCTFDRNNNLKKTYINGVLVGTAQSIGTLEHIGTNASIGNSSTNGAAGAGNQIYGMLSDVRIYGTALSASDILTIYKNSGIIDNEKNIYAYDFNENENTIAYMDNPTSITSYGDTFSQEVINDITAPSGKALKLICTAQGTQSGSRGFYLSGGAAAWTRAKQKMTSGNKYKLSLWVKMNRKASGFKMNIECASKQSETIFDVGETYKKLENVFVYDSSTQHSAITSYGAMFNVGDEVYISALKVEAVDSQLKLDKNGIWTQDFIESENDAPIGDVKLITVDNKNFITKDNEDFILNKNEYILLEYIENTSNSWIDTLYVPNKDTGIELDFQLTAITLQNRLMGVRSESSTYGANFFCYDFYVNGSCQWAYAYNDTAGNWISTGTAADLNRHTLKFNYRNKAYSLDDYKTARKEITGNTTKTNTLWTLPVFGGRILQSTTTSIVDRPSKMKVYSLKIYEKSVLQREFVPCKRVSDDAIGLYEIKTKQFFTNVGSGTLVAGPEVVINKKLINSDAQVRVYDTSELTCQKMIEI